MTTLTAPTPVPNAAAKSQLARLMATENITVEFEAKAQTASFNMESRVLILPVWKDLADDALDMLIGHEVSHALHTPAGAKPLMDACNAIDSKNPMVAKDYLNVVEDARIERMIKARFPGLKRSFAEGYRDLMKRDLFGLKKIDKIADLPLIDRINLQYKIGWLIDVPFTAAELPLAQRVATTITWDDVVALSKEIYDLAKQQQKDQDKKDGDSDQDDGEDGEEGAGASPESKEGEDESESDSVPSDKDEGEEDDDGEGKSSKSDADSDADEESDSEGEGDEGDNADADEDGTEGGEKSRPSDQDADSDNDSDSKPEEGESNGKPNVSETSDTPAPSSKTLKSMEQGLQGLVDATAPTINYADLPSIDKGYVIPLKKTQESLRQWVKAFNTSPAVLAATYGAWKTNNAGAVQVLATEFDRRKAADAHKRTAIAETGSIDPNRLHAYRIAEDIFLQNAYVKEGKNHGIVLLLDMSGSMGGIFHDTMIQLVTLAHFCRRVNVPFVFYGYSDRDDKGMPREPSFKKSSFGAELVRTRLFTLLSDGMKQNEFVEQSSLLLLASVSAGATPREDHPTWKALAALNYRRPWHPPEWMMLDNTPTNGALLGMPEMVEEFKRVKRVQIANLIVLTDGEPSDDLVNLNSAAWQAKNPCPSDPNEYRRWSKVRTVWRDVKRRKEYVATTKYPNYTGGMDEYAKNREEQSALLMDIVRDRTDAKTICIHLMTKRTGGKHAGYIAVKAAKKAIDSKTDPKARRATTEAIQEKVEKSWADNDWVGVPMGLGFNEYIVVRTDLKEEAWDIDEVDMTSKSGLRDLRKTFTKSMAATRANRPLLTRVADLISKK